MGIAYNPKIVSNDLVLSYDFANVKCYPGNGTNVTDLSGFKNSGIIENSPAFTTNNLGSLSLDGTNERVTITCSSSTIRSYNTTSHFIIKLPQYSGGQRAILSYRYRGGGNLYIGKANNGIFCYYDSLQFNGSGAPGWTFGNIPNGGIAICAVTLDANNSTVNTYINGSLVGSTTRNGGWSSSYNNTMYLGWDPGTNEWMLGEFYQFLHYNRVLSADEIKQNFNALRGRFGL